MFATHFSVPLKKKKMVVEKAQLIILSSFCHCSSNCSTPHWRLSAASDSSPLMGFSSTTSSKQPPYSVKERIYSRILMVKPMITVLVCIALSFSPCLVRISEGCSFPTQILASLAWLVTLKILSKELCFLTERLHILCLSLCLSSDERFFGCMRN